MDPTDGFAGALSYLQMEILLLWPPKKLLQPSDIKRLFIMLTESAGQEFGQGTAETAWLGFLLASVG